MAVLNHSTLDPTRTSAALRRSFRALWAAGVLGGLAQSLAGTAGALLARDVAGSDAAAGLPQALLVVGAALSALVLSAFTRRLGRRIALAAGAGAAMAGCIVISVAGWSESLPWILIGSLLVGCGTTAVMLGRYAAADLGPESGRARAMASVLMATTIGAVAGPNLLGPSARFGSALGLPDLTGPYLVAAAGFAAAGLCLSIGLVSGSSTQTDPLTASPAASGAAPRRPRLGRAGTAGLIVLSTANLVMVAVMTMTPIHLHHLGVGLGVIGLVVSLHIGGMFAPSPLSGWLADRFGPVPVAVAAGPMLIIACVIAARGAASSAAVVFGVVLLGIGWNLALVAGSLLLTADVPAAERPRREGWGEVGMGAAAAGGGAVSGLVMLNGGYPALAAGGAAVAALLLPWVLRRSGAAPERVA